MKSPTATLPGSHASVWREGRPAVGAWARLNGALRRRWKLALAGLVAVVLVVACALAIATRSGQKSEGAFRLHAAAPSGGPAFALALYQSLGERLAPSHTVTILDNGAVFDALVRDIAQARVSVHVVMYIWAKGAASDRVVAALVERARTGVTCRILFDAFGSSDFATTVQPALAEAGCEVRKFRPLPGVEKLARNHRKIVVLDGALAYAGGFGIRDSWLGDGVHAEGWRDTNVRFAGPAVADAQQAFAENWQEAGGALLPANAFPALAATSAPGGGGALAAFVSSTASPVVTRAERLIQLMVSAAKKRLWIANAYFVPSRAIVELLGEKAAQGVDVRILTAGKKSDSKTSFGMQQAQYGGLSKKGVRVWEYQPSMMHSKTMLVDEALALVGSINLDPLSLTKLDESALVVEDLATAAKLEADFLTDCTRAEEQR